jgi:hypothetical protein
LALPKAARQHMGWLGSEAVFSPALIAARTCLLCPVALAALLAGNFVGAVVVLTGKGHGAALRKGGHGAALRPARLAFPACVMLGVRVWHVPPVDACYAASSLNLGHSSEASCFIPHLP